MPLGSAENVTHKVASNGELGSSGSDEGRSVTPERSMHRSDSNATFDSYTTFVDEPLSDTPYHGTLTGLAGGVRTMASIARTCRVAGAGSPGALHPLAVGRRGQGSTEPSLCKDGVTGCDSLPVGPPGRALSRIRQDTLSMVGNRFAYHWHDISRPPQAAHKAMHLVRGKDTTEHQGAEDGVQGRDVSSSLVAYHLCLRFEYDFVRPSDF